MSKNIIDGVLVEASPSMISTFDNTTAFGCERRGWFKYVAGLEEPQTGSQSLGTELHALIESRLSTGNVPELTDNPAAGLYLSGESMIEEVASRIITGVEVPLTSFSLAGVKIKGFIDVVTNKGILDWKTTSDIKRYGKRWVDLITDTQMVLYAQGMHPALEVVTLSHGLFQTKGRQLFELVEVDVKRESLDKTTNNIIIPLLERIKEIAKFESVEQAVPNRSKCVLCPFRAQCPSTGTNIMKSFFKSASESPAPVQVLPPDAPPTSPALFADPPPEQLTIVNIPDEKAAVSPAPKRGPGRPKKSSPPPTPPTTTTTTQGNLPEVTIPSVFWTTDIVQTAPEVAVKEVTVSKGFTINLGDFNSVRFDVSVTADSSNFESAYAQLLLDVQKKLDEEAEKCTKLARAPNGK